jgi:hypothetical protein
MEFTWLGRSVRRLGRVGIALIAAIAGVAAFAAASMLNLLVTDLWFYRICGLIGLVTAVTLFGLCDRLGLVPDDSDPPTTLSLSGPSTGAVSPSDDRYDRDPRTFRRREAADESISPAELVQLTLSGWNDEGYDAGLRRWRNVDGDVLSLCTSTLAVPKSDEAVRMLARSVAEGSGAGLIEATTSECRFGSTTALIYKRLLKPQYVYTGMLIVSRQLEPDLVWTVVSGEIGTTGVREAVITAELMNAGQLTLDEYQRSWAQDPYEPEYANVDRSVLRFMSDDEQYDYRFPSHPLSKVRATLRDLPTHFTIVASAAHSQS